MGSHLTPDTMVIRWGTSCNTWSYVCLGSSGSLNGTVKSYSPQSGIFFHVGENSRNSSRQPGRSMVISSVSTTVPFGTPPRYVL